jgi:hypothetical protein
MTRHRSTAELEAGLESVRQSPREQGPLELIVRRPAVGARETLEEADLDPSCGLVGDRWATRAPGKQPSEGTQLTIINSRAIALVEPDTSRWPLAGDQLFIELDLSRDSLPPGTRLHLGTAALEIAEQPHLGCAKFVERFGLDAMKFFNSPTGRALNLRGVYARVLVAGRIRRGDLVTRG